MVLGWDGTVQCIHAEMCWFVGMCMVVVVDVMGWDVVWFGLVWRWC